MKQTILFSAFLMLFSFAVSAQVDVPRESQKQTLTQTVGDTTISIVYSRPNVKARKIWGELVPYDKVWRAGANEATVFEVSREVNINGKPLPAGKYSLHAIPTASDWTLILNKDAGQWGSFKYDEKQDALRVTVKPVKSDFRETLSYGFSNVSATKTDGFLAWENISVPFTIDIGDISGRVLVQLREAIKTAKAGDVRPLNQAAGYVAGNKLTANYDEALGWIDKSIAAGETYANLSAKARLLKEQGKNADAIATAEKAISVGKASTPPANPDAVAAFEATVKDWKTKK